MPATILDRAWELAPQVSVRPEPFGALLYHFGTRRLSFLKDRRLLAVVEGLAAAATARQACAAAGEVLDEPICLTWELTYACNLACRHCLSSSGRRDRRELTTPEAEAVIDELERMQVFYVNIGGGEPTIRPDFWALVDYATAHHVGVKFSTNGVRITAEVASRLASSAYVDVQISLDGASADVNDALRGDGSFATAVRAMENLADAGVGGFKLSVVCTRHNVPQLDAFQALADRYGAQLRLTRLRPSGRRWGACLLYTSPSPRD